MELSLRLDTLGVVELRYLRSRERYRDWPSFQLLAASRQARVMAYMSRDVIEQLHQQILVVEAAVGLDVEDEDENGENNGLNGDEGDSEEAAKPAERDSSAFSPAFAQTLKQLNELARQRLPDSSGGQATGELASENEMIGDEEDAIEQLQDAFIQMMDVVRELAEEMSTDALKITGRFKCARTNIEFIPQAVDDEVDEDDDEEEEEQEEITNDTGIVEVEVELVMVLQLFEEGRTRVDDVPAVELQLDVEDFERLHETLDFALTQERRNRRRR